MDGVFRPGGNEDDFQSSGRMDSPPDTDVLLETVEASADGIHKLMQLGVSRDVAITHGVSRKGYWRLAKTLATNSGMTNRWLLDQGLVFVRYLWSELAPLRRTA